jgi:prepilin-type N-terminal cleavage/methylation domain-containing protein
MRATQRGLTLIELMIVLAVMAIIAAVGYPLYTNQVQKSRRADAKIALESVAMVEERFYTIYGQLCRPLHRHARRRGRLRLALQRGRRVQHLDGQLRGHHRA